MKVTFPFLKSILEILKVLTSHCIQRYGYQRINRNSHLDVFLKKLVLKNFAKFTGKHLCLSIFFNKKDTMAQVFSGEFCETFKNTFFHGTPPVAASESSCYKATK